MHKKTRTERLLLEMMEEVEFMHDCSNKLRDYIDDKNNVPATLRRCIHEGTIQIRTKIREIITELDLGSRRKVSIPRAARSVHRSH